MPTGFGAIMKGAVRAITTGSVRPAVSLPVGIRPWIVLITLAEPAASGTATSCAGRRRPEADWSASAMPR